MKRQGRFQWIIEYVTPFCTCKVGMGGLVSQLSEELRKDSTADGGQGDKQEWWEVKALRQWPANSGKLKLRLQHLNGGMLFNLSEKKVNSRRIRWPQAMLKSPRHGPHWTLESIHGDAVFQTCCTTTSGSVGAPYNPQCPTNAQRKQLSAMNTSGSLYASVKMNATFHITADYMSYITAVAEFILSVYSERKQLTQFLVLTKP